MDGRLLALSVAIFISLVIAETSAQSFYPLRYGKRDGPVTEVRFMKNSKYHRRSDLNGNNDFFYGSRYGKRSYNATPSALETEFVADERNGRYGRSPETEVSDGNSKFYFGSRFGKRSDRKEHSAPVQEEFQEEGRSSVIVCRFTGFRRLYHCLSEMELRGGPDKVF